MSSKFPLTVHTNRTQITGLTNDNTWRTVDLTSFLQRTDTKIVLLEMDNPTTVTPSLAAIRDTSSSLSTTVQTNFTNTIEGDHDTFAVALDGSNQIQYRATNQARIFIKGELGGDGVETFSTLTATGRTNNAWGDEDITSSVGVDAGNIEAIVCVTTNSNLGRSAVRSNGSTDSIIGTLAANSTSFDIAKVDDDDIFERFVSRYGGKSPTNSGWVYMVGYIKRGYLFEATEDHFPAETTSQTSGSSFLTLEVDEIADEGPTETQAIIQVRLNSNTTEGNQPDGMARSVGSTDPGRLYNSRAINAYPVNLDSSFEFEYLRNNANFTIHILGVQYAPQNRVKNQGARVKSQGARVKVG